MPERDGPPRLRPFWSGTIAFGLVSVAVELYPATTSRRPALRMVAKDGTPLRRRYLCPAHGREVSDDEIVRGFDVGEGELVVLDDDELEGLAPDKTREIDLTRFVEEGELDPLFFERSYLLAPAEGSVKAYRLLAEAMQRTGRAGIATFVMREKEYLVAILASGGLLRAETLRFAHEVRSPADVGVVPVEDGDAGRVRQLRAAVRAASDDALDEAELEDPYRQRLEALAERKRKRGKDVVTPAAADEGEGGATGARIIDLMEALRRSLAEAEEGERAPPARAARGGKAARDGVGLEDMTREELYERARELDVPGRSSMTKAQLVRALRSA